MQDQKKVGSTPDVGQSDVAVRAQVRQEVLRELVTLLQSEGGLSEGNLITLSDYELVNLREALQATGYGFAVDSPLRALHTGDWLGQVVQKLQGRALESKPNKTASEMAENAKGWSQWRA